MSVENFLEPGPRKNLPELPKCRRTPGCTKQQKSFSTYHLHGGAASRPGGQVPELHCRPRKRISETRLPLLALSRYGREFSHGCRSTLRKAAASGSHRHVGGRKDVLDKEVSGKRDAGDFLRRLHRAEAFAEARGRGLLGNKRSGRVDGLAGQHHLCGAGSGISCGRDSHAR